MEVCGDGVWMGMEKRMNRGMGIGMQMRVGMGMEMDGDRNGRR